MSRSTLLWGGFAVVCLLSLGAPILPVVAGEGPTLVAGLPLPMVWNVTWVLAAFASLGALHLMHGEER